MMDGIIPNLAAFKYEIQQQTNTKQDMDVIITNLADFKLQTQTNTNTKQLMDGSVHYVWLWKNSINMKLNLFSISFKALKVLGFKVQNTLVILLLVRQNKVTNRTYSWIAKMCNYIYLKKVFISCVWHSLPAFVFVALWKQVHTLVQPPPELFECHYNYN